MRANVNVSGQAVMMGVGLLLVGYVAWRGSKAIDDALDWFTGIPKAIGDAAKEGGQTFQQAYEANTVNRTNTPDSREPVYNDPLINDAGMDFRYY